LKTTYIFILLFIGAIVLSCFRLAEELIDFVGLFLAMVAILYGIKVLYTLYERKGICGMISRIYKAFKRFFCGLGCCKKREKKRGSDCCLYDSTCSEVEIVEKKKRGRPAGRSMAARRGKRMMNKRGSKK